MRKRTKLRKKVHINPSISSKMMSIEQSICESHSKEKLATINNNKCKIWYQSQKLACQRCQCLGHHTSETDMCDAYIEDPDVITIRSPQYFLCNYYPSHLKVFETEFSSSEHAYQWRF